MVKVKMLRRDSQTSGKSGNCGGGALEGLLRQFSADKKKNVIAVCLIAVMIVMWLKVFTKKGPETAAAATPEQILAVEDKDFDKSEQAIVFKEPPKISGRNDALKRDFFTVESWQDFASGRTSGAGKAGLSITGGGEGELGRIAKKIELVAVEIGARRRAFINDELLSVGDRFYVTDGGDKYECEVTGIEEDVVLIRCEEKVISLKLSDVR